jgi:hypothetical protein
MVTESKQLAFFSGTKSEFNRVLPVGESIAGFSIKTIAPSQVELEHDGKLAVLVIGRTMQLEGTVAPDTEAPADTAPPSDLTAPASSSGAPPSTLSGAPPAPGGASSLPKSREDVLKQMMERRQKEFSK